MPMTSEYAVIHAYKPAHRVSVTQMRATSKEEAEKEWLQQIRGAEKLYKVLGVRKLTAADWS